MRRLLKGLGGTVALAVVFAASPASARPGHDHGDRYGAYYPPAPAASFRVDPELAARCGFGAGSVRPAYYDAGYDGNGDRWDGRWDGRRERDRGIGGALIGGAVGGIVGNRIAGRGDRVIGTVGGAALGAIAGAAIDRAEDGPHHADRRHDDRGWGYGEPGYVSAECDAVLPAGYRLVAVPGEQECRDEVTTTEEWVPEYVTVPATTRAPARDKRTKLRRVK